MPQFLWLFGGYVAGMSPPVLVLPRTHQRRGLDKCLAHNSDVTEGLGVGGVMI